MEATTTTDGREQWRRDGGNEEVERRRVRTGVWFESAEEYEQHFRNVLATHRHQITTWLLELKFHKLVNDLRFYGLRVGVELNKLFDDDPKAAVSELLRMVETLDIIGWCRFLCCLMFRSYRGDLEVPELFLDDDYEGLEGLLNLQFGFLLKLI